MYSDTNRRASERRANDAFLRHMLGGELVGGVLPTMHLQEEPLPDVNDQSRVLCDGSIRPRGDFEEGMVGESCPIHGDCPDHVHAPSLAMVYAPKQCWRNLLDPKSGLAAGTIFAELVLPFERGLNKERMEVRTRR